MAALLALVCAIMRVMILSPISIGDSDCANRFRICDMWRHVRTVWSYQLSYKLKEMFCLMSY
jgi:hypothetical protein